jgi:hypothetical protein
MKAELDDAPFTTATTTHPSEGNAAKQAHHRFVATRTDSLTNILRSVIGSVSWDYTHRVDFSVFCV